MTAMVWKLLLLLLLLWDGPTFQNRKTKMTLAHQANGHLCEEHSECRSKCCIRTSYRPNKFCSAKSIFLQCVSWRKQEGDKCQSHSECWSLCCLPLSENSPLRCTKRTGLLALCLPV
ncbi:leucine-rich colipase-like protein 1 isoform X3 [Peromyscus maniculatus bairdii]|nr:leucine-rich colipase-like protein 1 isoform X2 [Peromyscus maniculatus bairdii]